MLFRINGEEACNSKAEYKAGIVGSHEDGGHGSGGDGMLSSMSACNSTLTVKKGDKISMEAFYDMELHPL